MKTFVKALGVPSRDAKAWQNMVWIRPLSGSTQAIATDGKALGWIDYSFTTEQELFLTPSQALAWHNTRVVPEQAGEPEGFPVGPAGKLIDELSARPATFCGDLDMKAFHTFVKWTATLGDQASLTLRATDGDLLVSLKVDYPATVCQMLLPCQAVPAEGSWHCLAKSLARLLTPTSRLTLVEGTLPLLWVHDTVGGAPRQYLLATTTGG